MEVDLFQYLSLFGLEAGARPIESDLLLAGIFFFVTAGLVASCVPGVLLPMALSSGALLGPWQAVTAVGLGAVAGSQLFFLMARYFGGERLRARLGSRLESVQQRFAQHGTLYVLGLRLVGAPQIIVGGGCALMPIRGWTYAAATLFGVLPAISIAAATGSAI